MTNSDIQFRTDEHIAQTRQFYDRERGQSVRSMGQTISQFPGQIQQAQANKQQMELRSLQAEMQRAKMTSDLRVQETIIQSQDHQNQLALMRQFDDVDISRMGVEAVRMDLESKRMALDESKKQVGNSQKSFTTDYLMKGAQTWGLAGTAQMSGKIPQMMDDGTIQLRDAKDQAELDQFIKDNPNQSSEGIAQARLELDTNRAKSSDNIALSKIARDAGRDASDERRHQEKMGVDREKLKLDQGNLAAAVMGNIAYGFPKMGQQGIDAVLGIAGIKNPIPGSIDAKPVEKATVAAEPPRTIQAAKEAFAARFAGNQSMNELQRRGLAGKFVDNFAQIRQEWDGGASGTRGKKRTDQEFTDFIATILNTPGHPFNKKLTEALISLPDKE